MHSLHRQLFVSFAALFLCVSILPPNCAADGPFFASGIKIGEVDQSSAIIWSRLTKNEIADFARLPILTEGMPVDGKGGKQMPIDVVAGIVGETRVRYRILGSGEQETQSTDWKSVSEDCDFIHQFKLTGLSANTQYEIEVDARSLKDKKTSATISGRFKTAPSRNDDSTIRFVVTTCQAIRSIDSGPKGHVAYKQMLDFDPNFFVHTGDILYFDKAPFCKTAQQARAKWNLMFAYGHNQDFHRQVSSYFMKDDHDTLKNDCWPGQTNGELTFAQGQAIFREQVPMGEKTYRTIRWGRDVQIWLTENRDFRSENRIPDGPEKTILGAEQKAWLKTTMQASDAKYKFLITPGPIVGPDKPGKEDNHSNDAFFHEGQELREFVATLENTYVICGDRHWQYCSQDPETGVIEFGSGPINDQHTFGGDPGEDPKYHRFFSNKGGFLGVTVENGEAKAEWFTVDEKGESGRPKARYKEALGAN